MTRKTSFGAVFFLVLHNNFGYTLKGKSWVLTPFFPNKIFKFINIRRDASYESEHYRDSIA